MLLDETAQRLLGQVGRRTPLGGLLRRYWQPIAAVAEIEDRGRKAVKLLGEELVLYRDRSGTYGLIDEWCPHARADLQHGSVEAHGFRCQFHGWLFDEQGRCLAMGNYEADADRVYDDVIKAYPVATHAGLVWAYLGPEPAPPLPSWEPFGWRNGSAQTAFAELNCHWLQLLECALDPAYFEWVEKERARKPTWTSPFSVELTEQDFGFSYRRRIAASGEVAALRLLLLPNALLKGNQIEWYVPMDDGRTLSVSWLFNAGAPAQEQVPYWLGPVRDPQTQRWLVAKPLSERFLASLTEAEDGGPAIIRHRLLEEAQRVAAGGEPKALAASTVGLSDAAV